MLSTMYHVESENDYLSPVMIAIFFQLQTVVEKLFTDPLVPPQLTVKDFYMTGTSI